MSRKFGLSVLAVLGAVALITSTPFPGSSKTSLTTETLGGTERYQAYVALDKPIYRPGESVLARVTILHALTRKPLAATAYLGAMGEIRGPKGEIVSSGYINGNDSLLGFRWDIPADMAGGEYTLKMTFPDEGFPPAERKFDIRVFRAPRLKSQIVFLRDGYGPGERATAILHTERAEGGFPDGAKVGVSARVDGQEIDSSQARVDPAGNCTVTFQLPATIERGEGTLALTIEDGGTVETAAKTIPILLQALDISVFPEGGDLVGGLPCRLYVEARTPARKPADFTGVIEDETGKEAARFRTEHEGRGRVEFTPVAGRTYRLRVVEPAGIKVPVALPPVKTKGVSLTSLQDSGKPGAGLRFRVAATENRKVTLTLNQRETEQAAVTVSLQAGVPQELELRTASAAGVLSATVWGEGNQPLAERLVFVAPRHRLKVSVESLQKTCTPGSTVNLKIRAVDETGKPVAAQVGLTVTDDSVLEMVEKREQAPRLPAMVYLENEVRELADAHLYLDPENPKAAPALDLLLGTQGWRRFALVDVVKFLSEHGDPGRRLFAVRIPVEIEMRKLGAVRGGGIEMEDGGMFLADRAMDVEKGMAVPQAVPAPMPAMAAAPPPAPEPPAQEAQAPGAPADLDALGPAKAPMAQPVGRERLAKELNRRQLQAKDAFMEDAEVAGPQRGSFAFVREFAHQARVGRQPGERSDFAETVFWNVGLKTDPRTGEASLSFQLSDSVTAFRVLADAFTDDGTIGEGSGTVESVEPFNIEPKMPLEVTAGDQIELPIGLINRQAEPLPGLAFTINAGEALEPGALPTRDLPAGARERAILPVYVGSGSAQVALTIQAKAGPLQDKVTRTMGVKPAGFPIEVAAGGLLGPGKSVRHPVMVPAGLVPSSLTAKASVFPTPLANLTAALERMLVEPCGCFEQTSSSNFPLVMAQQYFQTHTGVPTALIQRGQELLDKGYQRLVGFECKQKGYEWFGSDPAHEALTAYGLLEFVEMAKVRDVDAGMLGRTRTWLLSRRDGSGGFRRDDKALDSFGRAPEEVTNAYITWALLEAGEKAMEKEVERARKVAASSSDPYLLALTANILFLAGDADGAHPILAKLSGKQAADGGLPGAATSITMSGGEALTIETTALAVLAWLRNPEFTGAVEKGLRFLTESCKDGRFGSTQSTILALRAILAYDQARAKPKAPGSVQLVVDGQTVGGPVAFDEETKGAIELPAFAHLLKPGSHEVELRMIDGAEMPYSLAVTFNAFQPANSTSCKLALTTSLAAETLKEGSVSEARVKIGNRTKDVCPMPVAIIGLPGGLEPRHDQLKELVKAKVIDAYEVLGRDVVLYWRAFKPEESREVNISLIAAIPGTYTGPAARAYLYYTDEHKTWVPGLKAKVTPIGEGGK